MTVSYPPDLTMAAARTRYFENNGFGPDGGYGAAWVDFKLGPIPFPFPNTPQRIDAVKFHDLHHVLTGYDTDFAGELEISAWEIAAGCKCYAAAWVVNLGGIAAGLVTSPGRVFAAFLRGRHSSTVYGEAFEPLLERTVGELRAAHVAAPARRASLSDVLLFVLASAGGLAVAATLLTVVVPLVPVGLALGWWRRRTRTGDVAA